MTTLSDHLASGSALVTCGGVFDESREMSDVPVDPHIGPASLVYEDEAAAELARTYRACTQVASATGAPFLALTETRWASSERIERSRFWARAVNGDHVRLHQQIAASVIADGGPPVFVAGVVGPRDDTYASDRALTRATAARFHALQVEALASAGADCLAAVHLAGAEEALGLADVLARTDLPYLMSFVIAADDRLPDGSELGQVIRRIDDEVQRAPAVFFAARDSASSTATARSWQPWCIHRRESCLLHVGPSRLGSVTSPR
jgi:hypothetical protein